MPEFNLSKNPSILVFVHHGSTPKGSFKSHHAQKYRAAVYRTTLARSLRHSRKVGPSSLSVQDTDPVTMSAEGRVSVGQVSDWPQAERIQQKSFNYRTCHCLEPLPQL